MIDRIYSAAEAQEMLDAFRGGTAPCPDDCNSACADVYARAVKRIRDAAPDLAASVAFHARRAEKAQADLTVATDRARDAEAESAAAEAALTAAWQAITDDDLPRLPGGDGTVVDAEAVGRRVAAAMAERDKGRTYLEQRVEGLTDALSSIVRGVLDAIGARDRKVPPLTLANLAAWVTTETRLVVDDLAMTRDNHHARAEKAEADLTVADDRASDAEAVGQRVAEVVAERDRWRDALRDAASHSYVTTPASPDDPEGLAQNLVDVMAQQHDAGIAAADVARAAWCGLGLDPDDAPEGDSDTVANAVQERVAAAMAERDATCADVVELRKSRDFWRDCEARQRAAADLASAAFVAASDGRANLARQVEHLEVVLSSIVRGILDAIGAREREVPSLSHADIATWLATETRFVVDDLATLAREKGAERDEALRRVRVVLSRFGVADCDDPIDALESWADEEHARCLAATDERNAIAAERDAALAQAEPLTQALRSAQEHALNAEALAQIHREERDAEHAAVVQLNDRLRHEAGRAAEVGELRALAEARRGGAIEAAGRALEAEQQRDAALDIVKGWPTPPSAREFDAHAATGGEWIVREYTAEAMSGVHSVDASNFAQWSAPPAPGRWRRWWSVDRNGIFCAWPVVTEAPCG